MDIKLMLILIVLLGISFTETLGDGFTSELKAHDLDDYDVTTIYMLQDNLSGSVKCSRPDKLLNVDTALRDCKYDVSISSRTNSIGMPIYFNNRVLSSKNNDLEFIIDYNYYSDSEFTKNHVEDYGTTIVESRGHYSAQENRGVKYPAGGLIINSGWFDKFSLNISWTPYKTFKGCVTVTYYKEDENYSDAYVKIYQKDNNIPMVSYKIETTNGDYTLTLRTDNLFLKNTTYFVIIISPFASYRRIFGVKRVAQCDEDSDSYVISGEEVNENRMAASIYQMNEDLRVDSTRLQKECQPNRFGADCSGICSIHDTFCERMLFCTTRNGCSCASGYFGDFCDKKCPRGTYGRDCKQSCNKKCNSCDIYTGACI